MATKHTPGPWNGSPGYTVIISTDRYFPVHAKKRGRIVLATKQADARLIAKAPEMLGALIECRKEFAKLPRSLGYDFTHMSKLDALIDEATGEAA